MDLTRLTPRMASLLPRSLLYLIDGPPRDKEDSVKVSYLKLWVGDKGLDVFEGFTFAKPEDALKLRVILQKFEDYCARRKNHIMAALKFNERRQGERDF